MSGSPERPAQAAPQPSVYERIGGADGVRALVARFYELMDELPEAYRVRRLHPESLAGSADSLFKFLSGWFGGPPLYVAERGHPRLRMRHLPYAIGPAERDEWLLCMRQALAELVTDDALRAGVDRAFTEMADHMVNTEASDVRGPAEAGRA
ncbi:MAG: group II truncated hemoglobin [Burkholderiaceae bacterium]|nr:group II truncated hemoglobin [Burkholderiaceae bacterium]